MRRKHLTDIRLDSVPTTIEFLDAMREKLGGVSDYRTAAKLGISKGAVSSWRQGKTKIGEQHATRVAKILELDPTYVLMCVNAERAKDANTSRLYQALAILVVNFAKGAGRAVPAVAAAGMLALSAPHPAPAAPLVSQGDELYIMRSRRRQPIGPDPRADRSPGFRRRRRRARPDGRSALTVTALTERRSATERRVTERLERDRRHGTVNP